MTQHTTADPTEAWLRRQRERQTQREANLQQMRERAGYRPNAAMTAAIAQRSNRLEHSR